MDRQRSCLDSIRLSDVGIPCYSSPGGLTPGILSQDLSPGEAGLRLSLLVDGFDAELIPLLQHQVLTLEGQLVRRRLAHAVPAT